MIRRLLKIYITFISNLRNYAFVFLLLGSSPTFPNGVNPVRSFDVPLYSVCTDKETNEQLIVHRVNIRSANDVSNRLKFKTFTIPGEFKYSSSLKLVQIESIEFLTVDIDESGYREASVKKRSGNSKSKYVIEVMDSDTDLYLSGTDTEGSELSIPLSNCKIITFNPYKS